MSMSASMVTRSPVSDSIPASIPASLPDLSAGAERADQGGPRPDPKASAPVEPHWEGVIAAATD
jgi:hypothetical protein